MFHLIQAKTDWQTQHDASLQELRESLESSHRAALVMAKNSWRQEMDEENKKVVEEEVWKMAFGQSVDLLQWNNSQSHHFKLNAQRLKITKTKQQLDPRTTAQTSIWDVYNDDGELVNKQIWYSIWNLGQKGYMFYAAFAQQKFLVQPFEILTSLFSSGCPCQGAVERDRTQRGNEERPHGSRRRVASQDGDRAREKN